jgi:thiamine pyrophosphokinase
MDSVVIKLSGLSWLSTASAYWHVFMNTAYNASTVSEEGSFTVDAAL